MADITTDLTKFQLADQTSEGDAEGGESGADFYSAAVACLGAVQVDFLVVSGGLSDTLNAVALETSFDGTNWNDASEDNVSGAGTVAAKDLSLGGRVYVAYPTKGAYIAACYLRLKMSLAAGKAIAHLTVTPHAIYEGGGARATYNL